MDIAEGTKMPDKIAKRDSQPFNGSRIIGADIPLDSRHYPLKELLIAFRNLALTLPDVKLVLAGSRSPRDTFSVWNYVEENELSERVHFLPYFDMCRDFPLKKTECITWISRNIDANALTSDTLRAMIDGKLNIESKTALFVTCFHPGKYDDNSRLMRHWLDYLKSAAYRVHLLYYAMDIKHTTPAMRRRARCEYDLYREVEVVSGLVGTNKNGFNVHVDDWCGEEAVRAAAELGARFEYDVALVNYPFMTAVFDVIPSYTHKILLAHDRFTDRNRRMLAEGYASAKWVSIDEQGERIACSRADTVVALKDDEAEHFRQLSSDACAVRVVAPIIPMANVATVRRQGGEKLRIGYFGSSNWMNEQALAAFIKAWLASPTLPARSELVLAGGVCDTFGLAVEDGQSLLEHAAPKILGRIDNLDNFFNYCDIVINPERGGASIKINTLEAMASGVPVLTTQAGAVGLGSTSRFHSAKDANALAELTAEVSINESLLEAAQLQTSEVYGTYYARNYAAIQDLLGAVIQMDKMPSYDLRASTLISSEPIVSIIVPFHNVEQYIEECIKSVVNQDYINMEFILVDDASPDSSRIVADRLAARDSRIRIVTHTKNQGLGCSRNTGVRNSTGQYIFFLDSDDYLSSSSAISSLVNAAQRSKCRVVVGGSIKLMPDGTLQPSDQNDDHNSVNRTGDIVSDVDAFLAGLKLPGPYYLPLRAWGMLIERALYDELALDFPPGEHEDLGHTPFLYFQSGGVLYTQDIVVTYRIRLGSISNSPWSSGKLLRYGELWKHFKVSIFRFGLDKHLGDAALAFTRHLFWKLRDNGLGRSSTEAALALIGDFLRDVSGTSYRNDLYGVLDLVREFAGSMIADPEASARLTRSLPISVLLDYYRRRLSIEGQNG
jgi:glycosyltransferase involved in cell wall biosynthesis